MQFFLTLCIGKTSHQNTPRMDNLLHQQSTRGIGAPVFAWMDVAYIIAALPWWRHHMKTFSALLAICAGNSPVTGEFPAQRPVTRSFDVSFDLRLNKRLNKQSWGWQFETQSRPLWGHRKHHEKHIVCMFEFLHTGWNRLNGLNGM